MSKSDNKNAKDELLGLVKHYNIRIIGALIQFGDDYGVEPAKFTLPLLYTDEQWNEFLEFMDREYYSGYGGQELFGTVVCEDGAWLERGEYDGSEWWEIHRFPDLKGLFGDKIALKYFRKKKLDEIEKIGE